MLTASSDPGAADFDRVPGRTGRAHRAGARVHLVLPDARCVGGSPPLRRAVRHRSGLVGPGPAVGTPGSAPRRALRRDPARGRGDDPRTVARHAPRAGPRAWRAPPSSSRPAGIPPPRGSPGRPGHDGAGDRDPASGRRRRHRPARRRRADRRARPSGPSHRRSAGGQREPPRPAQGHGRAPRGGGPTGPLLSRPRRGGGRGWARARAPAPPGRPQPGDRPGAWAG